MQCSLLCALLFALLAAVTCAALSKKADEMSAFASALNGAGRLRYGKRSVDDFYDDFNIDYLLRPYEPKAFVVKRASVKSIIDTINGAERLRFGRK